MYSRDGVDCDDGFWMKYLTLRMEFRRNHHRTGAGGSDNHSHKVGGWRGTSQADVRAWRSGGMVHSKSLRIEEVGMEQKSKGRVFIVDRR